MGFPRLLLTAMIWVVLLVTGPALAEAGDVAKPSPPRGAIVVAPTAEVRADAKALARAVYGDAKLRAALDEKIARALIGEGQPEPDSKTLNEVIDVVRAVGRAQEESVVRRLLTSLGRDLRAQLVVLVKPAGDGAAVARVLRVSEQRFLSVTLTGRPAQPEAEPAAGDWKDAVALLRGLLHNGAAPGPRAEPAAAPGKPAPGKPAPGKPAPGKPAPGKPAAAPGKPAAKAKPLPADEAGAGEAGGGFNLLESPWFWGGVGLVVAAGITVFVLSETALDDPGTVRLQGRISP